MDSSGGRSGYATLAVVAALCGCALSSPPADGLERTPPISPGTPPPSASSSPQPEPPAPDLALEEIASGLTAPVDLVPFPDATGRSALVEQHGLVHVLQNGAVAPQPFLDIRSELIRLSTEYDERGLLTLAFHPRFADNGRFFVYYSAPVRGNAPPGTHDHTNVLAEFSVSDANPNVADPATQRRVLVFEQPQPNHSGGGLAFGPDGYLYLGTGDGGGTGDDDPGHSPQGNAQDLDKLNGKILRIDVDGNRPYRVPPDNPFTDGSTLPEIYAYGLRNPWRLTWEPDGARRLLVVDPGWGLYEEVNVVQPGANYGWPVREGDHCVNHADPLNPLPTCAASAADGGRLQPPVVEYPQVDIGSAVIGGHVYRGQSLPALRNQYVFGDFSAQQQTAEGIRLGGTLLVAEPQETGTWPWRPLVVDREPLAEYLTGIGQDQAGELYLMVRRAAAPYGDTGRVLRLVAPDAVS